MSRRDFLNGVALSLAAGTTLAALEILAQAAKQIGNIVIAEREIAAITLNRWPHGYAYEFEGIGVSTEYGRHHGPHIRGRQRIGRISREKLAYVVDSTAAPISVLIPFSTWGAFFSGLLVTNGLAAEGQGLDVYISAIPYMLYAWAAVMPVFIPTRPC